MIKFLKLLLLIGQVSCNNWDEGFDPIGIFQCNDTDMWETEETTVDVDWDNEMYWDDEVEPAFDKLEL